MRTGKRDVKKRGEKKEKNVPRDKYGCRGQRSPVRRERRSVN